MPHRALIPGFVALVTGGASGIGLAAAKRFAELGLRICIADIGQARIEAAVREIAALSSSSADVLGFETDVGRPDQIEALRDKVTEAFGGVDVLMNNAGIQPDSSVFGPAEVWDRVLSVNLMAMVTGTRIFLPDMIARGRPGLVINTGSKQGITTPPGNPAYNVSKAGVKVFTEALQHELRNMPGCLVEACLLIPGFVFTGLTAGDRTEKPAAAWTPEQTVDFLLQGLDAGDFYILCPDNDVPRALDEKRIRWAAGDIIRNRPPLSRWHADYADLFAAFLKET